MLKITRIIMQKNLLRTLAILILLTLCTTLIYISLNCENHRIKTNIKHFQEDGLLVCYSTLIVSNENWKLNQDHLIKLNHLS